MELTKWDRGVVSRLSLFKKYAIAHMFFGVLGICFGAYSHLCRSMSSDAIRMTITLELLSVGFAICGYYLWQTCRIIEKLAPGREGW